MTEGWRDRLDRQRQTLSESKQGRVAESLEDKFGFPCETQAVPNFTLKLMLAELIDLRAQLLDANTSELTTDDFVLVSLSYLYLFVFIMDIDEKIMR